MKILFMCATPYHILNAINFVITNKGVYDICIMPDFENVENVVSGLRNMNIFENVLVLNETNNTYTKAKSFYRLIAGSSYIRKLFKNRVYDKVLYCLTNPVLHTIIVEELKKYNKKLKCYFVEDGIGSYAEYLERITPKMRSFYSLLGKHPVSDKPDGVYFYKPELVILDFNCEYLELPNLTNIKKSSSILNNVNNMLGYKPNPLYNGKVIYLNQPLLEDGMADVEAVEKRALAVFDKAGLNPVIKCHPRAVNNDTINNYDNISDKIPLELVMLNNDMSDRIFVTPFSTAAITPKLNFNQEPKVIFLYKLYNLEQTLPQLKIIEKFILLVKEIYSDQSRIQIPSTFKELEELLQGNW